MRTGTKGVSERVGPTFVDGSFEFDPALVVSDVSKLCIKTQNGSIVFATLSGFLTTNK